jgi:hypothetical protein
VIGLKIVQPICTSFISEIKLMIFSNHVCKIVLVDRGQARASHCLANWTRWCGLAQDLMLT